MSGLEDVDLCTLDGNTIDWAKGGILPSGAKLILAGSILQIQQVVNISRPKEESEQTYDPEHDVLKLTLTEGVSTSYGIVTDRVNGINMNTLPGSKIKLLANTSYSRNTMQLTKNNVEHIPGNVPKMIEKWEFQRRMNVKQDWGAMGNTGGSDGPPLWRPFGQSTSKIDIPLLRKTKVTDILNEKKEGSKGQEESETEFGAQRLAAITEILETRVNRSFQRPNKNLVDRDIAFIMEEGFNFEAASVALKRFKTTEKALKFLKPNKPERPRTDETKPPVNEERREKKNKKIKDLDEEEAHIPVPKEYQRPTQSISLFGFIAEHIKSEAADLGSENDRMIEEAQTSIGKMHLNESSENRQSYSRGGRGGRGSRGGRGFRGDRGEPSQRYRGKDTGYRHESSRVDSEHTSQFDNQSRYSTADERVERQPRGSDHPKDSDWQQNTNSPQQETYVPKQINPCRRLDFDRVFPTPRQPEKSNNEQWPRGQGYNGDREQLGYDRGSSGLDYGRDQRQGKQYGSEGYRTDQSHDQGRQSYSRGADRQSYNRDYDRRTEYNDVNKQDFSRGRHQGRQPDGRNEGRRDHSQKRIHNDPSRSNYPSSSHAPASPYSPAQRYQKQPYHSSWDDPVEPYRSPASKLAASQSFPQPDHYRHPSRDYDANPRYRANGVGMAPPDQYQYGNSDSWNPGSTLVFSRTGGARSREHRGREYY